MPWVIKIDGRCPSQKPWGVVNQQNGDLRGCHPSKEHARQQQKTLYAKVPDARPQRSAEPPEDATTIPAEAWVEVTGGLTQPRSEGNA